MGKKYIKCPRCELNYILEEEDYCHVCKTEMKHFNEGEDDGLLNSFEDMELCPVCGVNYIKEDQGMCKDCKKKKGQPDLEDGTDVKTWSNSDEDDDDDDDSIRSDIDNDGDLDDETYNSGFGEIDITADPYKVDDDTLIGDDLGGSIEFSSEDDEDDDDIISNESADDFEVVEVSDDDDDEEDEDDYKDDDDDLSDLLGKRK